MPATKVVFAGECLVGKSCLIGSLLGGPFLATQATVSTVKSTLEYKHHSESRTIEFWDTAGQERYRSLTPMYFRDADVAILVFDQTDHATFDKIPDWDTFITQSAPPTIAKIIVGNKYDLDDGGVADEEIETLTTNLNALTYFKTSARTRIGVQDLLEELKVVKMETGNRARSLEVREEQSDCGC
jgi:small GTP-binding protein